MGTKVIPRRMVGMTHFRHITTVLALSTLACSAVSASALSAFTQAQRATLGNNSKLIVAVKGIEQDRGSVMVALFDNEADYEADTPLHNATMSKSASVNKVVFDDIPVGQYAFKLYRDSDGDGEITWRDEPLTHPADTWSKSDFLIPAGTMIRTVRLEN